MTHQINKFLILQSVYKYMTNTKQVFKQSAETQAGQGKIFFENVDILSASCLIFATESGYFSTLAPI